MRLHRTPFGTSQQFLDCYRRFEQSCCPPAGHVSAYPAATSEASTLPARWLISVEDPCRVMKCRIFTAKQNQGRPRE
jgi:hypothetical protein